MEIFGIAFASLWIAVILALVIFVGWFWNIVRIAQSVNKPLTGMFVLRCVGIFITPLGAVLGYIKG